MHTESVRIGFHDRRLEATYHALGDALRLRLTSQITCLAEDRAEQRKFASFLHNPHVHLDQLIWGCVQAGRRQVQRAGLAHVLVVGDTTEANLKATQGSRHDHHLGVTGNNADPGFFLHPGVAVCPTTGHLLGCVSLQVWTRQGGADLDGVESQKWCITARQVKSLAPRVTVVNDREGDIFALWSQLHHHGMFMVTRARHDRRLVEVSGRAGRLWERLAETEVSGVFHLQLAADHTKRRSARRTSFSVRCTPVTLKTPGYVRRGEREEHVQLWAIEVRECAACVPTGETPVVWRVLTNHAVQTYADALQIVQWYVYRWRIEETFSAFKSRGVDLEASRLTSGEAVMKLGVMAYHSATTLTELVKARDDTITPATAWFSDAALSCMDAVLPVLEGKTEKQKNPYPRRTAAWAVWILARLGHWHGTGKPGSIVIRRGLERFDGIFLGYSVNLKV